ncbi:MAG TPA: energy transducer TonB [Thermoanaerobaculia bacterium]|nr:energy transducer TonB [Thermoanaerobaculia bacterium]
MQEEPIDLVAVAEERKKTGGLSLSVVVSLVLHSAMILWFLTHAQNPPPAAKNSPITRYVELIQQNPQEFVEAPGPAIDWKPLRAPLSDANRKASMPEPTGMTRTQRPGDGRGIYTPPVSPEPRAQQQQQAQQAQQPVAAQQGAPAVADASRQQQVLDDTFVYRESTATNRAAAAAIDWRSAIKQVKAPSGGGSGAPDFGTGGGGDLGFADQGPLSFETAWFDWGPYAQSMVSRIRVNWYANMPQLIRTGIGGVVTIRFTIQRDGRITEISVLKSSGHPPYDFAARKAIELSSPLNPLPKEFPNPDERVTAMFYYNTPLPGR